MPTCRTCHTYYTPHAMVCPRCHANPMSLCRTPSPHHPLTPSPLLNGQRIKFVNVEIAQPDGSKRDLSGATGEILVVPETDPDWTPELAGQIAAYPDGDEYPVIVPPYCVEPLPARESIS